MMYSEPETVTVTLTVKAADALRHALAQMQLTDTASMSAVHTSGDENGELLDILSNLRHEANCRRELQERIQEHTNKAVALVMNAAGINYKGNNQ